MSFEFSLISAVDDDMGIGKDNSLAWRLKGDLQYFNKITTEKCEGKRNVVIMGGNTWRSLPSFAQPLKNRINVVLTGRDMDVPDGVVLARSFEDAFLKIEEMNDVDSIFVIGGASVYSQAIALPFCKRIYLTRVFGKFDCDTFFPNVDEDVFEVVSKSDVFDENGLKYQFFVYDRIS